MGGAQMQPPRATPANHFGPLKEGRGAGLGSRVPILTHLKMAPSLH